MFERARAIKANERGRALDHEGRTEESIEAYERASKIDPSWSVPHYNLGLVYKYLGDWERSFDCNKRAVALDNTDQASWWNLGIAATALARWADAREAWRRCGVPLPDGDGPVDYRTGPTPIRLNPTGDPEVVWSERIDPARAVIQSIPFPASGYRWHDLVLHDGAAVGYRSFDGREIPVFDCLTLLEPSHFLTFVATAEIAGSAQAAIDQLMDRAHARGLAAEDWSTNVRVLCKTCSEGRPNAQHHHQAPSDGRHRVALAAEELSAVENLTEEWTTHAPDVKITSVERMDTR